MSSKLLAIQREVVSKALRTNREELAKVADVHLNTLQRVISGGNYNFKTLLKIEEALTKVKEKNDERV